MVINLIVQTETNQQKNTENYVYDSVILEKENQWYQKKFLFEHAVQILITFGIIGEKSLPSGKVSSSQNQWFRGEKAGVNQKREQIRGAPCTLCNTHHQQKILQTKT